MNRIEEVLAEKGIKKTQFAEMMNTTKQNVNAMFRNPTLSRLEDIAKVLGVPVWHLLVTPDEVTDRPVQSSPVGGIVWGERFIPCTSVDELKAAIDRL